MCCPTKGPSLNGPFKEVVGLRSKQGGGEYTDRGWVVAFGVHPSVKIKFAAQGSVVPPCGERWYYCTLTKPLTQRKCKFNF